MTNRYRCTACGNLTRFDVTTTTRARAFHHYSVGGELTVEDVEVLSQVIEEVSCRWCSSARAVEVLADGELTASEEPPAGATPDQAASGAAVS